MNDFRLTPTTNRAGLWKKAKQYSASLDSDLQMRGFLYRLSTYHFIQWCRPTHQL